KPLLPLDAPDVAFGVMAKTDVLLDLLRSKGLQSGLEVYMQMSRPVVIVHFLFNDHFHRTKKLAKLFQCLSINYNIMIDGHAEILADGLHRHGRAAESMRCIYLVQTLAVSHFYPAVARDGYNAHFTRHRIKANQDHRVRTRVGEP